MKFSIKISFLVLIATINFISCKKSEKEIPDLKKNSGVTTSIDSLKNLILSRAPKFESSLINKANKDVEVTINPIQKDAELNSTNAMLPPYNSTQAKIKGFYPNIPTGYGWTGAVEGLGVTLTIRVGNSSAHVEAPLYWNCWQVGSNVPNSGYASVLFVLAYNLAIDQLKLQVQSNPDYFTISWNVQQTLINLVRLNLLVTGGSFSAGICQGVGIPWAHAQFDTTYYPG